jgi:serine/threonine protein kinase
MRSARTAGESAQGFHPPSSTFGGYRVERVLSTGTLGAVVSARHLVRDEVVVIKLLHPELRSDPVSMARLSREAHVLAHVASEHVVRLLDTGWTAEVGPYLVLEYLVGMDLARMLETTGPLPLPLAVDYLLQACEGLGVAHARGITHRDLKPENLFAVRSDSAPRLKLLDFGIAQHGPESFPYREIEAEVEGEGPLLGTPAYMSPERIRELPSADQRSDVWSLGVVLHELLTGRTPFGRTSLGELDRSGVERTEEAEICERVVSHEFDIETDRALLPAPVRAVIQRCLARHPSERYQTVEDLAAALRRVVAMPERWRGTLTGKFSRQLLAEEVSSAGAIAAPARVAPSRVALPRFALPRFALPRIALPRFALPRFALPRFASPRFALLRLARFAPARWGVGVWLALALAAAALAGSLLGRMQRRATEAARAEQSLLLDGNLHADGAAQHP